MNVFLDDAFETLGGVPEEIVTDNMKTVMDEPRTKGKVESPMRILDELRAYNGRLTYTGFVDLLKKINDRENSKVHPGTGKIPLMYLKKRKGHLKSPATGICKTPLSTGRS